MGHYGDLEKGHGSTADAQNAEEHRYNPQHLQLKGSRTEGDVKAHSLMPWRATVNLSI